MFVLSYSAEALADYASLANRIRREWGASNSAIIAFGGKVLRVCISISALLMVVACHRVVWGDAGELDAGNGTRHMAHGTRLKFTIIYTMLVCVLVCVHVFYLFFSPLFL